MNFVQVITLPLSLVQVMKVHPPLIMNTSTSIYHEKNTKYLSQVKHVTVAGWRQSNSVLTLWHSNLGDGIAGAIIQSLV